MEGEEKKRKGKGEWDAGPAGRQVPGAPHWQKTGLKNRCHKWQQILAIRSAHYT